MPTPEDLYDAPSHERLTDTPWSEERARAAIAAIVADAEDAFDAERLWPNHPMDEGGEALPPLTGIYLGASGVVWALDALARAGAVTLRGDWAGVAAGLPERYAAAPDLPEWSGGGAVPSLLAGESGILLVAHRLAPQARLVDAMVERVRANVRNPSRELMWGSPGTMLAAALLHERTGDDRLAEAWRESADWLWGEWRAELWRQVLYGVPRHFIGPGHGFAGNVLALARGDLLDGARREELERRSLATLRAHARRADGLAQWPPTLEASPADMPVRTQWCHGAPGIVISFAALAPQSEELTDMLVAGGELTWRAGPLVKGSGLCHGTAGNGFAFLKLHDRTGDPRWLERARAFGMHAADQVERARAEHGRGRYTLWTGDVGVALYLWACITADSAFPVLDVI
jgi:hypothetical protein